MDNYNYATLGSMNANLTMDKTICLNTTGIN